MYAPVNVSQPGLALAQSIVTQGVFPQRGEYGEFTVDGTSIGMIITTAFAPNYSGQLKNLAPANGTSLSTWQNQALYAVIGPNFSGNKNLPQSSYLQNFQVPSLGGAVMEGTSPSYSVGALLGNLFNMQTLANSSLPLELGGSGLPLKNQQYGTSIQYLIQVEGLYPNPSNPSPGTIGMVVPFAGNYAPAGFAQCNGQTLPIDLYPNLYQILGTTYGGDGVSTFGLPNLTGRIPIGTGGNFSIGQNVGSQTINLLPNVSGAQNGSNIFMPASTMAPSLALNFFINTTGLWQAVSENDPMLGQIMMYAGNTPPSGWVRADGQLLSIQQNFNLFGLIGNQYGGDGITTFAVPDLRDRAILGTGGANNLTLGQSVGNLSLNVTTNNLPDIIVPPPGISLMTDSGSAGSDHITNISSIDLSGVWPQAQVEYSKDGLIWTSKLQAIEGSNTIYVRQIDYIGQASKASTVLNFVLDTKAPVAPVVALDNGALNNALGGTGGDTLSTSFGTLNISEIEKGAIVSYSVDGGVKWSEHFEAVPGQNSVQVRQMDVAGNLSSASVPLVFNFTGKSGQAAHYVTSSLPDGGQRLDVTSPGMLPAVTGTAKNDVVYFGLQASLNLPEGVEDGVLSGLGGGNLVQGHAGSNRFTIASGSWVVDGGQGLDRVILGGKLSDFTITTSKVSGSEQTAIMGANGKIVLKNIEEIIFNDGVLVPTSSQATQDLALIYKAMFERAPDWNGLQAWEKAITQGVQLSSVAKAFLASSEAIDRYGMSLSNVEFVTALYQNVLGRNPDNLGMTQWSLALDQQSALRADVLIGIATSDEAKSNYPTSLFHLG